MKRGDIYFIRIPHSTGHEMQKDRPGIIVSRNSSAPMSTVNVVLCSSSTRDHPAHVTIRSLQRVSQAMCEHILTVDNSRIGTYLGEATPQEMMAVDIALASNLGLDFGGHRQIPAEPAESPAETDVEVLSADKARIESELNVYKMLYDDLLTRMLGGAR